MVVKSTELRYVIRGYYICKNIWIPELGEVLIYTMKKEEKNVHNGFACSTYLRVVFFCRQLT